MTVKQCKTCQRYIQFGVNPNSKDEHCWLVIDYFFMKPKICPHYRNGEPNTAYKEFLKEYGEVEL